MKQKNKIALVMFLALFLMTIIPNTQVVSFNQELNAYTFLEFANVNNATSEVRGFTIPAEGTQWIIEVADVFNVTTWDAINVTVYEDVGDIYAYDWNASTFFGPDNILVGAHDNTSFWLNPEFENIFPAPFIVPLNMVAVNTTLEQSMTNVLGFENYYFVNGTELMGGGGGMTLPISLWAIIYAWNGSDTIWIDNKPYGNVTGNTILVAIYMDDGWLHYMSECWWDNSSSTWNMMYKMESPVWSLFGGMAADMLPGETPGGMIPGFPCEYVILGIMASFTVIVLRKPRKENII